MHGHYAGRKFQVVVNLLDSIAANFRFVEALEISHCDGKPLNFVIGEVDGEKITKTIDFDASADYGKQCRRCCCSARRLREVRYSSL